MVASISKMASGQYKYYTELAKEDYYTKGGEPAGKWLGRGAARLGLLGTVDDRSLAAVLDGFAPGGRERLVKNAGRENRQPGWDLTFSAPKSVSVAWGLADSNLRKQIEQAQQKAVISALEYLEDNCIFARAGQGGSDLKKADAVIATFMHGTSRDLDPNLHTHCLIANAGIYGENESRTLKSKILYEHKMVAGALYRAGLASRLTKIGFELEAVKDWFEIKGIGQEARDFFSKRRQAILDSAGENASAKELDQATLKTRSVKGHVAREDLFPQWQEDAKQFGLSAEAIRDALSEHTQGSEPGRELAEKTLDESLRELAEVDSVHEKRQVLKTMLEKVQTGKVEAQTVVDVLDDAIKTGERLESLGTLSSTQTEYLTSAEIRDSEKRVLDAAGKLALDRNVRGDRYTTENVLAGGLVGAAKRTVNAFVDEHMPECLRFKFEQPTYDLLNEQQRDAIVELTTKKSKLHTVRGVAGAGKTTMLAAAREAWEANGYKVVGCAQSGVAAQELAKGAGIESETIRMTLMRLEPDRIRKLEHHAKMLVRAFFGQKTYQYDQMKLDKKTVLVVDEASMVGTKDLADLLQHAEKSGARVVLVGDTRQLPSVACGGAFAKIHEQVQGSELTTSVRQKSDWLKGVVESANQGDFRGALSALAHEDRLCLTKGDQECHEKLVQRWSSDRTEALSETIILASKNEDVDRLNTAAQDERRRRGELGEAKFTWNGVTYRTEDRVTFHVNDRKLGVWNGSAGTIRYIANPINPHAVRIGVELDSGELVTVTPGKLKTEDALSLGYASTVHKAQGRTVDKTFLMLDDDMVNRQSAYVGLTRSRYDTFVYAKASAVEEDVEELNRLVRKTERDQSKVLASEHERIIEEQNNRRHEQEESKRELTTSNVLVQEHTR
ncbi:relaxase domain-containing protein [Stieleria sp. ICT_E10.1]|uniref:MobF family relaxase n=1 Tax=Stieleria sedimenti TaxID=2976331 RepID=UPI00217F73D5|nr:MobF family relaxase [Stieleria sedimenti]MCS7466281.1 relaxase domain-containing protein [Stieleria sedimenti]